MNDSNRTNLQWLAIPIALALLLILLTRVAPAAAWEGDGRINLAGYMGGDSVYCVDGNMNPVSNPNGAGLRLLNLRGEQMMYVSPEQIAAVAHYPAANTLIAQGNGSYGPVYFSRLTDGRFQLTGQDDHGKTFVFEWTDCIQVTPIPNGDSTGAGPSFADRLFAACMASTESHDANTSFICHQFTQIITPICKMDNLSVKSCVAEYFR